MQGSAWINLLQRIPSSHHDAIALGLVTGAEVVVQQMIRMEQDFVIIKGRMSGSTAEGRIMMVPYSHLTLVAFSRLMTEPEVQEIFGQQACRGGACPGGARQRHSRQIRGSGRQARSPSCRGCADAARPRVQSGDGGRPQTGGGRRPQAAAFQVGAPGPAAATSGGKGEVTFAERAIS